MSSIRALLVLIAVILTGIPALYLFPLGLPSASAQSAASADQARSDFNGDGYDDLAIGSRGTIGSATGAGTVNVIYGSPSGLRASASGTTPDDQFWHQNAPGIDNAAETGDNFGSALAAGDFNDDGNYDLAIGVPGESIGAVERAGAVHVIYGSSSGLRTSSPADQFWHQGKPGVEGAEERGDGFGTSLAVGDFNDDGYEDLAIGTPQDRKGTIIEIGSVNVLYGSSSGLQTSSPADQLWNQESANVEGAGRQFERFGHSVAAHDFNGDGVDDLAVGVPQDGSPSESGAVNVLYGDSDGLQTTSPRDQYWHADSSSVKGTPDETREFGWFLG